jgi:hypothetical protein
MGYVDGMGLKEAFGGNPENVTDPWGLFEFEVRISPGSQEGTVIAKKSSEEEHWGDLRDIFPDVTDTIFQSLLYQFHPTEETHEVDITKFLPQRLQKLLKRARIAGGKQNCLSFVLAFLGKGNELCGVQPKEYSDKFAGKSEESMCDWNTIAAKLEQWNVIILKRNKEVLHGMLIFAKDKGKVWVMQRPGVGQDIEIKKLDEALVDTREPSGEVTDYTGTTPYRVR